ncbi:putative carbohydrate modification (GMD) [Alphaspiravirus yamagawaense]|uniref:Putative carbohydrate modification (GMD) n=1 Tax=Alphaspiravirus yamagawaense TaxID=1157339 RepID=J7Q7J8_9VIRU|nr:putative carbohydrate modification (GMD) [Aeropyrum coil-shaped virus]CCG27852.1 putative carbohydrate modification (GMD) [Aeropyrum coil-shaped virus]
MRGVRVLITGVTGFKGSYLAKRLVEEGWRVFGLVRGRSDNHRFVRLRLLGILDNVELVDGDMTDPVSLQRAIAKTQPDVIFHLAAQSFVGRSFEAPLETFNINAYGTVALLEAARAHVPDSKIIVAGSSEEYGKQFISEMQWERSGKPGPEPKRLPELPIREDNPLRPVSPYALSKVVEDFACQAYARMYNMDCTVLRVFNTEGPLRGEVFVTASIVKQLVAVKNGLRKYVELGNVAAMRDWSHIEDTIEAYYNATKVRGGVYNVGSGRINSVLYFLVRAFNAVFNDEAELVRIEDRNVITLFPEEVDEMILSYMKEGVEPFKPGMRISVIGKRHSVDVVLSRERFRPADVPLLQADYSRFAQATGWKPMRSLDDIIEDLVSFYTGRWKP